MQPPEERLLAALRSLAAGAARVDLDAVHHAFSAAFPQFDGSPHRRQKLGEMLDTLAAQHHLRLPRDRKRAWQPQPAPALPLRITLAREAVARAPRFDHQSFPWVPELAFISGLTHLHTPEVALRLHEFFKDGGSQRPLVPTKERSWQIFGLEKRLDDLQHGQLFGPERLTLETLRCRNVTQILAFSRASASRANSVLIIENESTFHSFCRLNSLTGEYLGVLGTALRAHLAPPQPVMSASTP